MTTSYSPFFAERKRIVELAGKYRLPAIYPQKEFVDEGGLMSYGADFDDLFRRAAVYVDKILKGAKPADLPVQQATKFEFVINLKAAKQIGLTIPGRVLERANQGDQVGERHEATGDSTKFGSREKYMIKKSLNRSLIFRSQNPKSAIQKKLPRGPNWLGLSVIAFMA